MAEFTQPKFDLLEAKKPHASLVWRFGHVELGQVGARDFAGVGYPEARRDRIAAANIQVAVVENSCS